MLSLNKLLMKVMMKNSKRVLITLAMNDILLTHKPRAIALLFSWENGDFNQIFKLCLFFVMNIETL